MIQNSISNNRRLCDDTRTEVEYNELNMIPTLFVYYKQTETVYTTGVTRSLLSLPYHKPNERFLQTPNCFSFSVI